MVVESPYVDRHYLDDFARYYAKAFDAPGTHCSRLHFFASLPEWELEEAIRRGHDGREPRRAEERRLQPLYLGFVVRRPLESARLGRTVLRTYSGDAARRYTVVRDYAVHLGNLRLEVKGLAYQQQDGGAAVCASTALWSALQSVAPMSGHRTPTPIEITKAAGSPFSASHGLTPSEMATALARLGYAADWFSPDDVPLPTFRAWLATYLQSKLPVILLIARDEGHAVTVTGFREPTEISGVPSELVPDEAPIPMRAASLGVIYVHDDNLGSHAHYELFEQAAALGLDTRARSKAYRLRRPAKPSRPIQKLRAGRSGTQNSTWRVLEWNVVGALVPKPMKLRLPIETMFQNLMRLRPAIETVVPQRALTYSCRFIAGVEYRREVEDFALFQAERARFFQGIALPRYVGVISVYCGNELLIDALLDVTEVSKRPDRPNLLAFIAPGVPTPSESQLWLCDLAEKTYAVPAICGQ